MPVVGWIDDITIGTAAFTNFIFQTNATLNKLFKLTKWILIFIAVLITLVATLITIVIAKN